MTGLAEVSTENTGIGGEQGNTATHFQLQEQDFKGEPTDEIGQKRREAKMCKLAEHLNSCGTYLSTFTLHAVFSNFSEVDIGHFLEQQLAGNAASRCAECVRKNNPVVVKFEVRPHVSCKTAAS